MGRAAGSPISSRLERTGRGTLTAIGFGGGGGPTAEEIAAAYLSGGGGGGGRSQADEIALIREQSRLGSEESARERAAAEQQAELNRAFERAQEQKRQDEERRQQAASIQSERQRVYTDLLGRDPVRAILFAMGIGPEADIVWSQLKSLGAAQTPLAGGKKCSVRRGRGDRSWFRPGGGIGLSEWRSRYSKTSDLGIWSGGHQGCGNQRRGTYPKN